MSNHSQAETLAVASTSQVAAQSIAKPSLAAVRPKGEYTEFFSGHCRAAHNVAKVFSHLVYRNQRNKPGEVHARLEVQREGGRWGERSYWWLTTFEDFANECGLTVEKVRTALTILQRLNQIEVHRGRHPINGQVIKYRGKTVLHIRLLIADRANGLDGWPTVDQMRIILGCGKPHPINWGKAQPLVQDALEVLDTVEVKDSNKGFLPEDPANPSYSESSQEKTGKDKSTSKPTPDAVVSAPKFSTKKKTGPKPKVVTPNGDWQHYNRMAKLHDMDALLKTCIDAGLVAPYRVMFADDECSMLERVEHVLAVSHWCTDTLENLILGAKDWQGLCGMFEELEKKDLHVPSMPNLKFLVKHMCNLLTSSEIEPDPKKQRATPLVGGGACVDLPEPSAPVQPAVSPAVCSALTEFEPGTWQDVLDVWAKDVAAAQKTAKLKPTYHA